MVGANIVHVRSHDEISALMAEGFAHRTKAKTNMNEASSRSHAVLTLYIEQRDIGGAGLGTITSKLSLIDLAGSERQAKTGATGARLKEGSSINKSLSALGNVVKALTMGAAKAAAHAKKGAKGSPRANVHVPYRDSTLTRLLQDSLGGNAVTLMICNVSPAGSNVAETLDSLRFAERAKKITNKALVNREGMSPQVIQLMQMCDKLKAQLKVEKAKVAAYEAGGAQMAHPSEGGGADGDDGGGRSSSRGGGGGGARYGGGGGNESSHTTSREQQAEILSLKDALDASKRENAELVRQNGALETEKADALLKVNSMQAMMGLGGTDSFSTRKR